MPSLPTESLGEHTSVNPESLDALAVADGIHRCSYLEEWILMEGGVDCVVEVVKEEVHRGVVVVARSKEDCYVECASVFSAVVQRNTGSAHKINQNLM